MGHLKFMKGFNEGDKLLMAIVTYVKVREALGELIA